MIPLKYILSIKWYWHVIKQWIFPTSSIIIDIWLFVSCLPSLVLLYAATSMNNQMRGYPREGSGGDDRWRDDRRHSSGGGGQRTSSSFEYGRGGGEGWRDMEVRSWRRQKIIHIFAIANNLLDQISAFKKIYANPKLQYLLHNKKESDQYRAKGEDWRCMEVNYFQWWQKNQQTILISYVVFLNLQINVFANQSCDFFVLGWGLVSKSLLIAKF